MFFDLNDEKVNEAYFEDPGFDYVVEIKEGERICFGSTLERNTDPIGKGLAPHQRRFKPELFPRTGPGCYRTEKYTSALYHQLHKIRSKAGVGPLASKDPRFRERIAFRTPSPGRYDIKYKWTSDRKHFAPFGVSSKLRQMNINNNPSPMTYDIRKISKCRRTRFKYNLGHPTMVYAVETVCVTNPVDTCSKCNKLCDGDYWHKDYITFLCQLCWYEERSTRETYNERGLKEFKKIRNCSFMHNHENTDAAIRTLPQNKIQKKVRLENYLDLYIKC